jgi:hypothetical protein
VGFDDGKREVRGQDLRCLFRYAAGRLNEFYLLRLPLIDNQRLRELLPQSPAALPEVDCGRRPLL